MLGWFLACVVTLMMTLVLILNAPEPDPYDMEADGCPVCHGQGWVGCAERDLICDACNGRGYQ